MLQGGTSIPSDADMDTYTKIGNYYCQSNTTAASLSNAPFTKAFALKVIYANGVQFPCQIYREYDTGRIAVRTSTNPTGANNSWNGYRYFSDDATVLGQTINASDILADIISDISEMDDINETCIRYVQGALLEGKSIYGFVLTAKAGTVLSQIIFGSFTGVSGMAVRGKSGSPIQWKDWKIL